VLTKPYYWLSHKTITPPLPPSLLLIFTTRKRPEGRPRKKSTKWDEGFKKKGPVATFEGKRGERKC
jgi:hypothetical protein